MAAGELPAPGEQLLHRLGELRTRLVVSAAFLVAATGAAYAFSGRALDHLAVQHPNQATLIFLGPSEAFFARLKLALAGGFVLSLPLFMAQTLGFFSRFLSRRDRIVAFLLIPVSFGLFVIGAAFAYLVVVPAALRFFLQFGTDELHPLISIGPYVSFVLTLVLPTGLVFELPIAVVFLTWLGIVQPRSLAGKRRYVLFGSFVLSSLLTPADPFSMVALAIPLVLLFEVSLLVARLVPARRGSLSADGL